MQSLGFIPYQTQKELYVFVLIKSLKLNDISDLSPILLTWMNISIFPNSVLTWNSDFEEMISNSLR